MVVSVYILSVSFFSSSKYYSDYLGFELGTHYLLNKNFYFTLLYLSCFESVFLFLLF